MDNSIKKESRKMRRNLRSGAYTAAVCAVLVAILVVVNLIVSVLPGDIVKLDLTTDGLYSLGETTNQVLEALTDEIQIYHVYEEGAEDTTISSFVERYAAANSNITVSVVDPGVNPTFTSQYTDETLSDNSLIIVGPNRNTVVHSTDVYQYYVDGQYMSSSDYSNYYYYMQMYGTSVSGEPFFFGEQEITSAIDYVTTDNIPVMYYTSKHGETEINSAFTTSIANENIDLKELDLVTSGAIPEDAEAIIINLPTLDFTADEISLLKTYMDNGGNVVFMTDYETRLNTNMPNLAAFCLDYGLTSVDGLLVEGSADHYTQYPYVTLPTLNETSAPAQLMNSTNVYVYMAYAHGIQIDENSAYTITPILTSSDDAYVKADYSQSISKADDDPSGKFYTGVHVTVDGDGDSETSTESGSLVWYSSSEIISANFINYGNGDLFISTLSTMCDKVTSISIIGKSLDVGYLEMDATESLIWQVIVTVIVPLAVIGAGLSVWYKRRHR